MTLPNPTITYVRTTDAVLGTTDPATPNGALNRALSEAQANILYLEGLIAAMFSAISAGQSKVMNGPELLDWFTITIPDNDTSVDMRLVIDVPNTGFRRTVKATLTRTVGQPNVVVSDYDNLISGVTGAEGPDAVLNVGVSTVDIDLDGSLGDDPITASRTVFCRLFLEMNKTSGDATYVLD